MKRNKDAFIKGWGLLRAIDQSKVKQEIMALFGIVSRNASYERRKGLYKLTYDEKVGIEHIFNKYNVEPSKIWGD